MTVHERPVGETVEWFTPPSVFERLGLSFDLDPAAPVTGAEWVPASNRWTPEQDGTAQPWSGRVWLNPPYGRDLPAFVDRMVRHRDGVLLVPARTETRWFQKAAAAALVVTFARDRIHFIRDDGHQARASFGSVFMAYGVRARDALWEADLGWSTQRSAT